MRYRSCTPSGNVLKLNPTLKGFLVLNKEIHMKKRKYGHQSHTIIRSSAMTNRLLEPISKWLKRKIRFFRGFSLNSWYSWPHLTKRAVFTQILVVKYRTILCFLSVTKYSFHKVSYKKYLWLYLWLGNENTFPTNELTLPLLLKNKNVAPFRKMLNQTGVEFNLAKRNKIRLRLTWLFSEIRLKISTYMKHKTTLDCNSRFQLCAQLRY